MNVEFSIRIYHLIQNKSLEKIKSLSQREREIVMFALKMLQKNSDPGVSTVKFVNINKDFQEMVNKLSQENDDHQASSFWKACLKGILNFFHLRISSHEIVKEISQINSIKQIPKKKRQLEELINALEFIRVEKPKSIYEDMVAFYNELLKSSIDEIIPDETTPLLESAVDETIAKKKIEDKIAEVKNLLKKAKAEGRDNTYIAILKNEVLKSLTNLKKYKKQTFFLNRVEHSTSFKKEIETNLLAFTNASKSALDCIRNYSAYEQEMAQLRKEIEKLKRKELEMNQEFIRSFAH